MDEEGRNNTSTSPVASSASTADTAATPGTTPTETQAGKQTGGEITDPAIIADTGAGTGNPPAEGKEREEEEEMELSGESGGEEDVEELVRNADGLLYSPSSLKEKAQMIDKGAQSGKIRQSSTGITKKLSNISILPRTDSTNDDVFAGGDRGDPKTKKSVPARIQPDPSKPTGTGSVISNTIKGGDGGSGSGGGGNAHFCNPN
jgi:hypothetical protein